jgi:hypothetical protein
LYFYKQLEKRKVTSRKNFDDVLKIIDTNNALDEEIEGFDTNFLSKLLKGKRPSLIDKDQQHDNQTSFQGTHIYTADELERAFYE